MTTTAATPATTAATVSEVLSELDTVIVGKRSALETIACAMLAGGHVLIEDLPGLGKTLIAKSFAAAFGLDFTRLQFTPDLLPADITGALVYDQVQNRLEFREGPVFTNLLLADEINRTPPKTQAALLEAMGENQVSVDGLTRRLPSPFIVLATDNPIEYAGTYPLPEAQLDRFALRVRLGYLSESEELQLLNRRLAVGPGSPPVRRIAGPTELLAMRESMELVRIDPEVLRYTVRIVQQTRNHPKIQVGASPRAALDLMHLARA
ncbi:MAG: AAA family ATPase, partial [Sciscionella sp.]